MGDQEPSVRESAAWALGRLSDADEAVRNLAGVPLEGLLDDPSVGVVQAAAESLGQLGGAEGVVTRLVDKLHHPDPETRRGAARALRGLEAVAAEPALLETLRDDDAGVRQEALAALGELGDRRAVGAFVERLLHDPDPGVRAEAAYRTGKLGDGAALAALRKTVSEDQDPSVRRWASWALRQIEAEQAKTG
jgi:HEAT repeat protein